MPCPHDCVDTNFGNGLVWARCNDCGQFKRLFSQTISQESLSALRQEHDRFMQALQVIEDALEKHCVHDTADF
jgi:hypothetical protein